MPRLGVLSFQILIITAGYTSGGGGFSRFASGESGFSETGPGSVRDGGSRRIGKRSLIFPAGGLLQFTVGISAALDLSGKSTGQVSYGFQQNVKLPTNFSEVYYPPLRNGKGFRFYTHFEDLFRSTRFNGSECLRKIVCQVAKIPLEGGFLEEMVNFFFSPENHGELVNRDGEPFLFAAYLGRNRGNCHRFYPDCPETPLDLLLDPRRFLPGPGSPPPDRSARRYRRFQHNAK